MESIDLNYPSLKIFKVITAFDFRKQGYKIVLTDAVLYSLVLRQMKFFFRKKFFEIKIEPMNENISRLKVNQVYTDTPSRHLEKKLLIIVSEKFDIKKTLL